MLFIRNSKKSVCFFSIFHSVFNVISSFKLMKSSNLQFPWRWILSETLVLWWSNVGPTSPTLSQHRAYTLSARKIVSVDFVFLDSTNTKLSVRVGLVSVYRLRRLTNTRPTLTDSLVFAGVWMSCFTGTLGVNVCVLLGHWVWMLSFHWDTGCECRVLLGH